MLFHKIFIMHLKQDKKPNLLWLQGLTCNANSHSFLNLPYLGLLLSKFNIVYHPSLSSLKTLEEVVLLKESCDILIFEGTFDPLMKRGDVLIQELLLNYGEKAQHIIALGTCARSLSDSPSKNSF